MHSDFSDSLCEMLALWLETAIDPPPTWEAVVTALRSPAVSENYLADQLESKYCNPVQYVMGEFNSTADFSSVRKFRIAWNHLHVAYVHAHAA